VVRQVVTGGSLTRRPKVPSLSPGRGTMTNKRASIKYCKLCNFYIFNYFCFTDYCRNISDTKVGIQSNKGRAFREYCQVDFCHREINRRRNRAE